MISSIQCGSTQKKKYELTVLILTYEQPKEKILLTVASAINQKEVDLQVIVSDDGSSKPYLRECVEFMENGGFQEYKVIWHSQNEGTVRNFNDALEAADGEYINSFGPGDGYSAENVARMWLDDITKKKTEISFCDSIYYKKNEEKYECIVEVAHPQNPYIYEKRKNSGKKYYLLYNDIFGGISVMCATELLCKYIKKIRDMVKYAEDNMFRLMLLDGVECSYFAYNAVYYEWGGISTKEESEFKKAIKQDWDKTTEFICKCCKNNYTENKIKNYYLADEERKSIMAKIYNLLAKLDIYFHCKQENGKKRLTTEGSLDYLYKLKTNIG